MFDVIHFEIDSYHNTEILLSHLQTMVNDLSCGPLNFGDTPHDVVIETIKKVTENAGMAKNVSY